MKHKNLKNSNFVDYQTKNTFSPIWKSLSRSRALLNKGIQWTVDNGKNINFQWENWVDNANLVELLDIDNESIAISSCKVSEFITRDECWYV